MMINNSYETKNKKKTKKKKKKYSPISKNIPNIKSLVI